MQTILKADQHDRTVYDITEDLGALRLLVLGDKIIKAERRGKDILILQRRAGGRWLVNYWWLATETAPINAVKGCETAKFSHQEIDPARSLFDQVNLF